MLGDRVIHFLINKTLAQNLATLAKVSFEWFARKKEMYNVFDLPGNLE